MEKRLIARGVLAGAFGGRGHQRVGEPVPPADRPGLRITVLSWLARRFSVDAVLPHLERAEHADAGLY